MTQAVLVGAAFGALGAWVGDAAWAALLGGGVAGIVMAGGLLAEKGTNNANG